MYPFNTFAASKPKAGMHFKILLIFALLLSFSPLLAQPKTDTAAIKKQLAVLLERDQKTRTTGDSAAFMHQIDSSNLVQVDALIAQYGWPGKSFVGASGNNTIFLVVQHADLKTQEKYLPLLEKSVAEGESKTSQLALLVDRVRIRTGKKQLYGSQLERNPQTSEWVLSPIEDEKNVNNRRSQMGLQPMEEYARLFGITYTLPTK